jgi:hypothetical protein
MKAKDFGPLGRTAGVRKRTTMNLRKKTHPTTRLIEAMLDLALLAGFISAMGFGLPSEPEIWYLNGLRTSSIHCP